MQKMLENILKNSLENSDYVMSRKYRTFQFENGMAEIRTGLSLWLRLKGSNRCENCHQKMESAIESWIVGPELVHHTMVMLNYRRNEIINAQRYNGINFYHHELNLIDWK